MAICHILLKYVLYEFDIFFDTDYWQVTDKCSHDFYRIMLDYVKEAIKVCDEMNQRYGMVCVVQDRWNPASVQRRSSFLEAHEAVQVLLKPKRSDAKFYAIPKRYSDSN